MYFGILSSYIDIRLMQCLWNQLSWTGTKLGKNNNISGQKLARWYVLFGKYQVLH